MYLLQFDDENIDLSHVELLGLNYINEVLEDNGEMLVIQCTDEGDIGLLFIVKGGVVQQEFNSVFDICKWMVGWLQLKGLERIQ